MSTRLFNNFIKTHNLPIQPVKSDQPTATAYEAATAHGVPVSNIVKSLVVKQGHEFMVYLCPGDQRLNLPEGARMANANEVKAVTGHSVGGVPPFGHEKLLKTVIVEGFDPTTPLWAAAGAQDTNFQTTLAELSRIIRRINRQVEIEPQPA